MASCCTGSECERAMTMYSETTRSIKVTVKPFYLEDQSSPVEDHYVWAYHVRIENRGKETVQLRHRHWRITDSRGQIKEVRGDGFSVRIPAFSLDSPHQAVRLN